MPVSIRVSFLKSSFRVPSPSGRDTPCLAKSPPEDSGLISETVKKTVHSETVEKRTTTTRTYESRVIRRGMVDVSRSVEAHQETPASAWLGAMPDRVRISVAGVAAAGCPDAAGLDGDYILELVERQPDQCRWEVSFPSQCRFYRMTLTATPVEGGALELRASFEGSVPGPQWVASAAIDFQGQVVLRFDWNLSRNPFAGCLWPETVSALNLSATSATGPFYISPEPSARDLAAMATLSASSSGPCQLTGISPVDGADCVGIDVTFSAEGTNLSKVQWTAAPPGDPPKGIGPSFTTKWDEPGEKIVTATCGDTEKVAKFSAVEITFAGEGPIWTGFKGNCIKIGASEYTLRVISSLRVYPRILGFHSARPQNRSHWLEWRQQIIAAIALAFLCRHRAPRAFRRRPNVLAAPSTDPLPMASPCLRRSRYSSRLRWLAK